MFIGIIDWTFFIGKYLFTDNLAVKSSICFEENKNIFKKNALKLNVPTNFYTVIYFLYHMKFAPIYDNCPGHVP